MLSEKIQERSSGFVSPGKLTTTTDDFELQRCLISRGGQRCVGEESGSLQRIAWKNLMGEPCLNSSEGKIAASVLILAASLDGPDGQAVRWLRVESPMGKELDSLADCVIFGVAQGYLAYKPRRHHSDSCRPPSRSGSSYHCPLSDLGGLPVGLLQCPVWAGPEVRSAPS
jgi:hypothetical protein